MCFTDDNMENFCNVIKFLNENGKAEWNGCILSKTLDVSQTDSKSNNDPLVHLIKDLTSKVTEESLPDITTYMYAESSCSKNMSNGFSDYLNVTDQPNDDTCNDSLSLKTANGLSIDNLVPFSVAQNFISHFSYCLANGNNSLKKFLPILALCDGQTNNRGIYFLLVQNDASDGGNACRIVTNAISCHGPYSAKTWDDRNGKSPSKSSNRFLHESSTMTDMYAEFDLFGSCSSLVKDEGENTAQSSIHVKCSEVRKILSLDPSTITSIDVILKPVPGGIQSPAFCYYKNLAVIQGLLGAFGPDKEVQWTETTELLEQEDMLKKLNEVVDSFGNINMVSSMDQNEQETDEDGYITTPRTELDFTERIWEVLKLVGSKQDLIKGIQFVFEQLELGRGIQFWLHEENQTYLAKLIRSSYEGEISAPTLQGDLPVRILAEIGIDKLQRDYTEFFFQNSISSSGRLDQVMSQSNPDHNESQKLLEKFEGLRKLHHIVELAIYCRQYLKLSSGKVLKVVRSASQGYLCEKFDASKTFTFSVSYSEVRDFLETVEPSVWKVKSKMPINKPGMNVCSLCWSRDFPFDKLLSDVTLHDVSLSDDTLDTEHRSFYYVTAKSRSVHA
uniref:Protein zwilch n=1 Tax=Phallusia mammillata TaxID=59560 RepID=A0A6F9DYI7_9ASCI|nr:protein zwilch homolog [Phallusia mammillata]